MKSHPRAAPCVLCAFFLGVLLFGTASARAAGISVEHPWALATPPKAVVGRAFMTIVNNSGEVDHLVGAKSDVARSAEVSGFRIFDSVPNLRQLVNIDIPAGGTVVFSPGAYHVLLRILKKPLVAGETFEIDLTFEKAGVMPVTFTVEKATPGTLPLQ